MPKVQEFWGYRCLRCGHEWLTRKGPRGPIEPKVCPSCRSVYWDQAHTQNEKPQVIQQSAIGAKWPE